MKYEMQRVEETTEFKPFSVTFTFITEEEYTYFHDKVMSHITSSDSGSHKFHREFFNMGEGNTDNAVGEII